MYALFYETEVYRIDDILEPEPFFKHVHRLLEGEECTLGLTCDLPNEEVKQWIRALPEVSVRPEYDFRPSYEKFYRKDHPDGTVVYVPSTPQTLRQLAEISSRLHKPYELCSHVIAFGEHGSLFSFHDAFQTDEMLISIHIPVERVSAFSSAIDLPYHRISNPQWTNPQ